MRVMSFRRSIRQIRDRSKTVTHRAGWESLKVGDVFEGAEWVSGVPFYVCGACFWAGSGADLGNEDACPLGCSEGRLSPRLPERLGLFKVVSLKIESLRDMDQEDFRREGFPELSSAVELAEAIKLPPYFDINTKLTRIEFSPIADASAGFGHQLILIDSATHGI